MVEQVITRLNITKVVVFPGFGRSAPKAMKLCFLESLGNIGTEQEGMT